MQRILVIDDEPYVIEALQRVLGGPTVAVLGAADAAAGLAELSKSPVDIAIVDVILPGMDGVAAIKAMRCEHPDLKIIAISGGGNFGLSEYQPEAISTSAYLAACRSAGADGTLAKPFETAELRALIGQVEAA